MSFAWRRLICTPAADCLSAYLPKMLLSLYCDCAVYKECAVRQCRTCTLQTSRSRSYARDMA